MRRRRRSPAARSPWSTGVDDACGAAARRGAGRRARRLAARAAARTAPGSRWSPSAGSAGGECAPHGDLDLVLLHAGRARHRRAGRRALVPDLGRPARPGPLGAHRRRGAVGRPRRRQGRPRPARRPARRRRRGARRRADRAPPPTSGGAPPSASCPRCGRSPRPAGQAHGELAFLLEGDLKEAAGGLRDVGMLRGIGRAGVTDALRPAVRAAHLRLLDTRDALHLAVGRRVDRLVAQERDAVAELLDLDDGDALLRRVAGRRPDRRARPRRRLAGRRPAARRPPPGRRRPRRRAARSPGTWSSRTASWCSPVPPSAPRPDPSLSLRVAAAAAATRAADRPGHLRVARPRSARRCPRPWPAAARAALVTLLGAGPGLVPDLGDLRPVRAGRRLAARVDPAAQPAAAQPGAPVHPRPAPGAGRRRGEPATPARWTGPTCCCSARSCTTSARACPATTAPSARRSPPAIADPDRPAAGRRGADRASWSGCTCCCPTWPPGATSATR